MDLLNAFIFGVVEGITEFLPVSSTGHLILTAKLLGLTQSNFLKSFEIAIQLGAILSVVALYGRSMFMNVQVLKKVCAAFIPTAILGFVFYKIIKKYLLGSYHIVLWAMFLGGIVLIVFEMLHKEEKAQAEHIENIPYLKAILIGVIQSLAMIPGVSRSAATIIGGLALGIKRRTIVEFSFLLAVPTMLGATCLDLLKNKEAFSGGQYTFLLVGFLASFAVALASIKFLLHFIQRHNFVVFGIYRIVAAAVLGTLLR